MICKIYDSNNVELMSFPVKQFNERLNEHAFTLTCYFMIEDYNDSLLEAFIPVTNAKIGVIEFIDEDIVVGKYTTYTVVHDVSFECSSSSSLKEGHILFVK